MLFLSTTLGSAQDKIYEASSQQNKSIPSFGNTAADYNPSTTQLGYQFGSGALFGAAGILVGGFTGYAASGFEGDNLSSLPHLFIGTAVGYLFGTSSGIYFVADSDLHDASFGYIMLGNIIGTGVGIGSSLIAESTFNGNLSSTISVGITISSTIIGGMVANNLSIKKKKRQSSALLNITDSNSRLDIPSIKLTETNHMNLQKMEVRNSYSPSVKLLNISL
jgi:hypothetical protein